MLKIKNLSPDFSKIINEGAFGDMYLCKQNDNIIIKLTKDPIGIKSGETNKKIIKKLKHPNILKIYGFDSKYNNISMIFMEYLNGITLDSYINDNYPLNTIDIINIMKQILNGLVYLHSNKITHRDIKFDNIFIIKPELNIKIIDFGLSYYGYPCKNLVGTSGFFAPEMLYSPSNYDSRCDVWSLGCMLYYLVCNKFPFYLPHDRNAYMTQLNNTVKIYYDSKIWNKDLQMLCENMLVYDYKKRYSSQNCLNFLNNLTYPI